MGKQYKMTWKKSCSDIFHGLAFEINTFVNWSSRKWGAFWKKKLVCGIMDLVSSIHKCKSWKYANILKCIGLYKTIGINWSLYFFSYFVQSVNFYALSNYFPLFALSNIWFTSKMNDCNTEIISSKIHPRILHEPITQSE